MKKVIINRRETLKMVGAAALGTAVAAGGGRVSAAAEKKIPITVAGYPYDRARAILEGRVGIEGCDTSFERSNIYELNAVAVGGNQRWEVQEMGLHPYMLAYANDSFRDYTLVPVFPLRTFRHKSIFIRTDRGINKPEDLRGKTVATPGYSQSSLVWIRGMLQHEYGVKPSDMQWVVTSKSADKGKVSKNESRLPDDIPIRRAPEGKDESELLVAGDVDAVFSAVELKSYQDGHPKVARLFSDNRKAEREYFAKTGIFPIMHAVAIRRDVVAKHPWLPKAAFEAYSKAKQLMYQELFKLGWAYISLPWIGNEIEETRKLMGENYWPYGIEPNRKALEALFQYSYEQGLAGKKLTIEELFHPSTLELVEL